MCGFRAAHFRLVAHDLSCGTRRVDFVAHIADDDVLGTGQAAIFDVKAFGQPHKATLEPIALPSDVTSLAAMRAGEFYMLFHRQFASRVRYE